MDDTMSRKVWECRNLPDIRKNMVNPDYIPLQSHLNFVEGLKSKNDAIYYVVLINYEFVGSINLHIENLDTAERGIYLHPEFQGKGLAKMICNDFYRHCRQSNGIRFITTRVLKSNDASNALEHALGASKIKENDSYNFYRLEI